MGPSPSAEAGECETSFIPLFSSSQLLIHGRRNVGFLSGSEPRSVAVCPLARKPGFLAGDFEAAVVSLHTIWLSRLFSRSLRPHAVFRFRRSADVLLHV